MRNSRVCFISHPARIYEHEVLLPMRTIAPYDKQFLSNLIYGMKIIAVENASFCKTFKHLQA